MSWGGFAAILLGLHWIWQLRFYLPRRITDPVIHPVLEAMVVIILGLYFCARGR